MRQDILRSLRSAASAPASGGGRGKGRLWCRAAAVLVAYTSLSCGGGESAFEGVTYTEDIRPIFNRRCTTCHRPGGPSGVDIRNPYSTQAPPNVGLARAQNQWKLRNPSLDVPEFDVKAGAPDDSFLIYKISDPDLEMLPEDPDGLAGPAIPPAGAHMPLQVRPLSDEDIYVLEDWVFAGAPNGPFMDRGDRLMPQARTPQPRTFADDIQHLFGVEAELNQANGVCRPGQGICARCVYCHYEGTPNPPNLSDPFGPEGVVNVTSILRPDMLRVKPGDPDGSLLIRKIRPQEPGADYGARMPYSFSPLSPDQVELVKQWIADGAHP